MTTRQLVSALWFVLVVALIAGACGDETNDSSTAATGSDPATTATEPPTTTSQREDPTTTVDPADLTEVIVDLDVEWQPEPDLDADAIARQREAIAEAQQLVIELLEGTSYRVIELYELTPQMALAVDGEGIFRMNTSDLVTTVSVDVPEPPTG